MRRMMMLCTAAATCALSAAAFGADWTDGFEDYACESQIVGQGGWEFWTGGADPGTARVSCDPHPVYAGEKSLRVQGEANSAGDDIVHPYSFINQGYWGYTAWQYIPADAAGGVTTFILLNQYPTIDNGSWSTVLEMNPDNGYVESQKVGAGGPQLPLIMGQWVEIKVLINLDEEGLGSDSQSIYYNGALLDAKGWSNGVQETGGVLAIGAVDLWSSTLENVLVYYDDLSLVELPAEGACCFDNGTCETLSPNDCSGGGGRYQGHGSSCEAVECPPYGDCGWMVTGPTSFTWTTIGQGDDCNWVSGSDDEQFEITIPYTGEWDFSLCGGAEWNTVITLGTECCGFDLGFDDNGCPTGTQSLLHFDVLEAGTYFLNLEDVTASNGGEYTITIDTPCILECPDGAYQEAEACGDDTNGGCNMTVPGFEPIVLDLPICGKAWYDGATRDTDWYEIIFDDSYDFPLELTLSGTSEFVMVMGLSEYTEGTEGSGNCEDGTGYISPAAHVEKCAEGDVAITIPNEGTYWMFVAPDFSANDVIECGDEDGYENDYVIVLTEAVPPCPWDFDGNGVVATPDLLFLLGAWGTPDGDVNDDGTTNTADLLELLGHWGPCP